MELELDITKSVDENAASYYEKAKKAKKKLKGALETIEKFKPLVAKEEAELVEKKQVQKKKRKQHWFEKFRWFLTSSGSLVVGGRDATTNEMVIKKHTLKENLVFHTDMAGSPFFVLQDKSEESIQETANATASFSRAWKNGMNTSSVFYVNPDQVTKEAQAGEYLQKGAFMIRGETHYVTNDVKLAIGVIRDGEYKDLVMCAPPSAVTKHCDNIFELEQSSGKASDIAKKLKKEYNVDADEIIRVLPPGGISLKKRRKRKHEL